MFKTFYEIERISPMDKFHHTEGISRNSPEKSAAEQNEVKLPSLENIRANGEAAKTLMRSVKFLEEFQKKAESNSISAIEDIRMKGFRTKNAIRSTISMINYLFSSDMN